MQVFIIGFVELSLHVISYRKIDAGSRHLTNQVFSRNTVLVEHFNEQTTSQLLVEVS
ncbi:MAG: hypothetical protein BWY72_02144 [Bacteroidetes bacterium ADurb.Bin416]|nr:MAG: hypothetical protein BWY72_02144 [Bacteroidetes bacterium ADurb.Bin416]